MFCFRSSQLARKSILPFSRRIQVGLYSSTAKHPVLIVGSSVVGQTLGISLFE